MILNKKDAIKALKKQYNDDKLIPFIGAGFSIPLKLPGWKDLMVSLGRKLGYEEDLFLLHGNYPQLAEYVKISNEKTYKTFIHEIGAKFHEPKSDSLRKKSEQHIALTNLDLRIVYTTNYDTHIELAYGDNNKRVKQITSIADFIKEDTEKYETEVVKFHGCFTEPGSIVLTESEYYSRFELENPLDQQLRSDALRNSFLFMGYSFGDPNIRYIWYKINQLIKNYPEYRNYKNTRPSYITSFGLHEIQSEILDQLNINVIELDPERKESEISNLLRGILL